MLKEVLILEIFNKLNSRLILVQCQQFNLINNIIMLKSQINQLYSVDLMELIGLMLMYKIFHLYIENQPGRIELILMSKINRVLM